MNLNYPWQLYHWHFGISSKCVLKCPRCPRTEYNKQLELNRDISLDLIQRTLTPDLLKNTVRRITMCGDLGDPIYNKEYLEIVEYIKKTNPNIHLFTITNGSYKDAEWWERFASLSDDRDTVNFSVDGFDQESNNIYRVNADWESIMLGMRIMAQKSTAFVNWAMIVFKFNEDRIDYIKQMATEIGCDSLQITKSTKFGSKYGETYEGENDSLEPSNENISSSNRYERYTIPISNRQLDIDEYLAVKEVKFHNIQERYNKVITPLCLIGTQGLYVNADGVLFPCSWKGLPYSSLTSNGKVISFQEDFFALNKHILNLNNNSLEDVLNNPVWDTFFNNLDNENAWTECKYKCSCDLVTQKYAVTYETN